MKSATFIIMSSGSPQHIYIVYLRSIGAILFKQLLKIFQRAFFEWKFEYILTFGLGFEQFVS